MSHLYIKTIFGLLASASLLAGGAAIAQTPTPPAAPEATAEDDDGASAEAVVVTANVAATTATRLPATALETPFTVVTMPKGLIDKTAARNLTDVMRYSATVGGADGFGNTGELFSSRGFQLDAGFNFFRDGLRYRKFGQVPLFDIERLELLRGPASVIYGALEPGGVLNIVSKKPQATPSYNVTARYGSYDYKQLTADLTGPVAKGVRYRLQGLFEDADSFRDVVNSRYYGSSLMMDFDLGPNTTLFTRGSYYRDRRTGDRGLVLARRSDGSFGVADVPRSAFFQEPWANYFFRDINLQASLRHDLGGGWQIRADLVRSDQKENRIFFFTLPFNFVVGSNGLLPRQVGTWDARLKGVLGRTEAAGQFDLGPTSHRVLIGGEFERFVNKRPAFRYNYTSQNIYAPVYTAQRPASFGAVIADQSFYQRQNSRSAYLQDIIDVGEHVTLLTGLRYDHAEDTDTVTGLKRFDTGAVTPQVGLVLKPTTRFSVYASYTRSFKGQTGTDAAGNGFDPLEGKQYEIGTKWDFKEIKTLATLSIYKIEKRNVPTADPANPGFSILSGLQESQGLELSIDTAPIPNFRMSINYAYLDRARFVKDNLWTGNWLPNVARHTLGVWGNYDFVDTGLSANLGMTYAGDRFGANDNTFKLSAYTLFDVGVRYALTDNIDVSGNVRNVFDKRYYPGAVAQSSISVGDPRTVIGTVSVHF